MGNCDMSAVAFLIVPLHVHCGLRRMGGNGTEHIPMDEQVEGSEATIEMKIKTLDSQTYTLRVDKQLEIVSLNVEDGHTLHLVLRQPIPPSAEGLPDHPGTDPASSTSRHVGRGVVIETLSMPVQEDGFAPEVNRIISAVLGSIGMPNIAGGNEGIEVRVNLKLKISEADLTLMDIANAVVNAGPVVFISPTGPNPIMVQPLPFQSGTNFGAIPMGAVQPGSGLGSGLSTGFLPRRIDIQIRKVCKEYMMHLVIGLSRSCSCPVPDNRRNRGKLVIQSFGSVPSSAYQTQNGTTVLFHPVRTKHNTEPHSVPSRSVPSAYQTVPKVRQQPHPMPLERKMGRLIC
ncbi:hypothetical protein DVH24_017681 [Malus domestica]|uniref:Ubiquitin-like domain-containing protein n=1 Tax=Malus domestica TaxID=3750 RepID=A0A498KBU6_MALDO|nr:hypothetical protein DVH24_017681 [Malus domestica]